MWVSLQRRSNANRARRYVGGLAISVAVHLIVAAVLSVRFLAPAVERAAREFTVAVVAWTPPNLAPTVRKAAPPASPAPEPADAPEPEKPSASMSSFAGVAGPMAVRGVRDPATLTARRIELAARDDAPFIERNDRIGSVVGNRPSSLPAFSALLDGSARATGEVVPVSLPEGSLSGQSPEVSREPGVTAARRGIGFENAGAGSYGSNASPIEGVSNGVYRNLMQGIARGIVANTETRELDIVFVVDTTASMVDNVRGVQAYADEFVNLLIADRRNVRFGLVTFADAAVEKPKTRGFTEKSSEFRTWLAKAEFEGGGDLAESALDAVMEGARRLKFRRKAQPYLILLSDGPFHDRDHDGQSRYTLDEVIAELKADRIVVDVVGLDYLPVKQLAWGTGGRWVPIPGKGYLEDIALPLPVRSNAALGVLSTQGGVPRDEVLVFLRPPDMPQWVELRWRVLSPRGERVTQELVERLDVPSGEERVVFRPALNPLWFRGNPGYYTAIYRITDSLGKSSVLRRVMDYR